MGIVRVWEHQTESRDMAEASKPLGASISLLMGLMPPPLPIPKPILITLEKNIAVKFLVPVRFYPGTYRKSGGKKPQRRI